MRAVHNRSTPPFLSLLLAMGVLGACSDDPVQPEISIAPITSQVSLIATGEDLSQNTQKSIRQLADDIAKVQAGKGGLSGNQASLLEAFLDEGARDPHSVTSWLWSPGLERESRSTMDVFGSASPSPFALIPVGVTCVWNVDSDAWKGSPDILGTPPADGIRFELYEVDGGLPVQPLEPIETYVDVRPVLQADETSSEVNVVVDAALRDSGSGVLSYVLTGRSDPDAGILDLLMSGNLLSTGGNLLDFLFTIVTDRADNQMTVEDLLVTTSLGQVVGGGAIVGLGVQKEGGQSIDFDFVIGTDNVISSGTVSVDDVAVANMSGARFSPTWNIVSEQFDEAANLTVLYNGLLLMDSDVNAQFFFAHCIGADHPVPCAAMVSALGG